jgi:hypothetical protein
MHGLLKNLQIWAQDKSSYSRMNCLSNGDSYDIFYDMSSNTTQSSATCCKNAKICTIYFNELLAQVKTSANS